MEWDRLIKHFKTIICECPASLSITALPCATRRIYSPVKQKVDCYYRHAVLRKHLVQDVSSTSSAQCIFECRYGNPSKFHIAILLQHRNEPLALLLSRLHSFHCLYIYLFPGRIISGVNISLIIQFDIPFLFQSHSTFPPSPKDQHKHTS